MKCLVILLLTGCATSGVDYAEYNYFRSIDAMQRGRALNCASLEEVFWVKPGSIILIDEHRLVIQDKNGKQHTIWRESSNVTCVPQ